MGQNEELSLQRLETLKTVKQVVLDIQKEHGKPIAIEQGDYSTRLTYADRCYYVTKM